mmetsp:Transcript_26399/g.62052  ORF Transcript_26399/g.62052 Transcript_26399/m.62052 type:complete len:89 (+) Transcript_26399:1038-1304(+)
MASFGNFSLSLTKRLSESLQFCRRRLYLLVRIGLSRGTIGLRSRSTFSLNSSISFGSNQATPKLQTLLATEVRQAPSLLQQSCELLHD